MNKVMQRVAIKLAAKGAIIKRIDCNHVDTKRIVLDQKCHVLFSGLKFEACRDRGPHIEILPLVRKFDELVSDLERLGYEFPAEKAKVTHS